MSQNQQILAMLRRGPITPLDALQVGCFRLAARIRDLREMGFEIHTHIKHVNGKRYAQYSLLKSKAA
ncbi:helix-turn-helix domain-containing protein [Spiribacter onubensis]|uniref:helix-turn-helix domain-containing protein n=1 Tax=Spiribacter onubensis TaxID=3122420 RepID=UPI00349F2118